MSILGNNTCLIGLSNVGEDNVNHSDKEAIVMRFTSIMNDGDDVGALLGHID